jgi:hypothetical protein
LAIDALDTAALAPGRKSVLICNHFMCLKIELPYLRGPESKSSAPIGLQLANQIAQITLSAEFL